jgi:hypothetical protein
LWANDSVLVRQLVQRIYELQMKQDARFLEGMFPSYRSHHYQKEEWIEDYNVFFTGLVTFTLRNLYPDLDEPSKRLCDSMFDRAAPVFPLFQNKNGRPTYNFAETNKPNVFPTERKSDLYNKSSHLADDLDDTVILLMAMNSPDSMIREAHRIMQQYANKKYSRVKNTYKSYKDVGAYSTWFGEKMPVDFDICVLANVLYMVNTYNLSYSSADSASLNLICEMVRKKQHLKAPSYVSPYYDRSPVILYHLSRLMSSRHIPQLEALKTQLVDEALKCYKSSDKVLDKIILSTALYRWGKQPPPETIKLKTDLITFSENNDFVFFVANMAVVMPNPLNSIIGKSAIAKYYYHCPAYNDVLLLENMIWKKRFEKRF